MRVNKAAALGLSKNFTISNYLRKIQPNQFDQTNSIYVTYSPSSWAAKQSVSS